MRRRLIFLIVLLVGVWMVAIYMLFFYQKTQSPLTTSQRTNTIEQIVQPLIKRLSDSDIEKFKRNVEAPKLIANIFESYPLKVDKEQLVREALFQLETLPNYKFRGYLSNEEGNFVMFSNGLMKPIGATLDDRYLIIHAVSFAAIVVDLMSGNLFVVK